MNKQLTIKLQQGFTLVELLIVVIILAILAAIVVPQFSASTDDAKISSLDSTLAGTRAIIDLYYQQHGNYPSAAAVTGAGAACTGTATAAGAAGSTAAFMAQLTRYTNAAGQGCDKKDAVFKYGPYLKKDVLPANPITNINTLVISTTGTLGMTGNATAAGWKFDNITGQFIADDAAYDDR